MKQTRTYAALLLSFVLCAGAGTAAEAGAAEAAKAEQEKGISRSFSAGKGGALEVEISGGSISVAGWDKDEVAVRVTGLDVEDQNKMEITQEGNTVRVRDEDHGNRSGDVLVKVNVPSKFDINLRTAGGDIDVEGPLSGKLQGSTSGGDIKLGALGGTLKMTTSGGQIEAKRFDGEFQVSTSGGDIHIGVVNGEAKVATSGGDIHIEKSGQKLVASTSGGNIEIGDVGGDVKVATSGGDVHVGKASGNATLSTAGGNIELQGANGTVSASTSGGDLSLQGVTGSIKGSTAGGNVNASLTPAGNGRSSLSTAGGDVALRVPENARATINAHIRLEGRGAREGETYEILSDFKVEDLQKDRRDIRGTVRLNGGGETITLETVNGKIEIRKLK